MANRERGEIGVEVEGKQYTLRPTFDSVCELENLTGGQSIDLVFGSIQQGRLSGLRATVWCLLQEHHADEIKTLKDASKWVERAGGVDVVMTHLAQLQDLNTEATEGAATPNPPRARAGTGRRSSKAHAASA